MSEARRSVIDLSTNVNTIEKSIVAKSTMHSYNAKLFQLMVWLFDNKPEVLEEAVLDQMIMERDADYAQPITSRYYMSVQRVEERISDKNTREYCFKELQKLESGSMQEAFYSPIILEGDNQLTYDVV